MIDDIDSVCAALSQLVAVRSPLRVFLEGDESAYASVLLSLDRIAGIVLADELHPASGHRMVATGSSLRATARLNGIELRFRSTVRAIDTDAPIAAYALEIPRTLDYRERRGTFRTRAVATRGLRARLLEVADDEPSAHVQPRNAARSKTVRCYEADVADVSIDGIRLTIARPHALQRTGVWNCALHLPRGTVHATIEIRHVLVSRRRGEPDRVGARFVGLPEPAKWHISRYAASLQRQRLRQRAPFRPETHR